MRHGFVYRSRIENLKAHTKYLQDVLFEEPECGESEPMEPEELEEFLSEWLGEHLNLMTHGTRGHYHTGCRDPMCVEANAQYDRRRRKDGGRPRWHFVQSVLEDDL